MGSRQGVGAVVVGTLAVFGLLFSSAMIAVIVAGMLQWVDLMPWLDNAIPIVVLGSAMMLTGRVAVDVAGRSGVLCTVFAAGLVALLGALAADASEAHGDGIEGWQVAAAAGCILVLTGGTALLIQHIRTPHT